MDKEVATVASGHKPKQRWAIHRTSKQHNPAAAAGTEGCQGNEKETEEVRAKKPPPKPIFKGQVRRRRRKDEATAAAVDDDGDEEAFAI